MFIPSRFTVNGQIVEADPDRSLLSVLRDDLGLTGAKYGCGEGRCGACTVLVNDAPRRSCVTTIGAIEGDQVRTIESLATDDRLHPLQQAFLDADAFQCGYCTAGMIMSCVGFLHTKPEPTEEDVVRFMNGNICRCGTYRRIVAAVLRAAEAMKEAK